MAAENLFTSQIPGLPNVFESANVTVATSFTVGTAGYITGGRVYGTTSVGAGTYELVLWETTSTDSGGNGTGTLLASVSYGTLTPSAWNNISFASPVAVVSTKVYRIGIRTSEGRYVATSAFWASAGFTNGNLTGISDTNTVNGFSQIRNGTFQTNITGYPNQTFNANGYFVDPTFDVSPGGGGGAAPSGLSIPAALGTPTAALGRTAAPVGLSVPVALGSPSAGNPISPSGLAVPVGLGSPSTSGTVVSSTPVSAGWYGLLAIGQENYAYRREERMRPPVACPNDGEPLRTGPDGELYCPWDGWQWQGPRV